MRGGSRTDEDSRPGRPRVVYAAGGALRLLPRPGAPAERRGSGGGNRRGSHRMGESLCHGLLPPEGSSATADGYLSPETTGSDEDPVRQPPGASSGAIAGAAPPSTTWRRAGRP